jgi:hypothetical protein
MPPSRIVLHRAPPAQPIGYFIFKIFIMEGSNRVLIRMNLPSPRSAWACHFALRARAVCIVYRLQDSEVASGTVFIKYGIAPIVGFGGKLNTMRGNNVKNLVPCQLLHGL